MTKLQMKAVSQIIKAAQHLGFNAYSRESYKCKDDAQRNLQGRTQYVDQDTMTYFNARILNVRHAAEGLYYVLQESVSHPSKGRVRRNAVFSITGEVVHRSDFFSSAKWADKDYHDLCIEYNEPRFAIRNSREAVREYARSQKKRAVRALAVL